VLFAAIAAFAVSMTAAVERRWLRGVAAVVAMISGVRAVIVLTGGDALEVVGPMAFIGLILCLCVVSWRTERYGK
jgi:uncharacterized membrane protein (DUF373 family)